MDVSYQLSPVNFPSESSPLPSQGIELHCAMGLGFELPTPVIELHCVMCPQGHMAQGIKALVRSSDIPKKSVSSIHFVDTHG